MPSAWSSVSEPVETASIMTGGASPIFITAPLPYCFSICFIARSSALTLPALSVGGAEGEDFSGLDDLRHEGRPREGAA